MKAEVSPLVLILLTNIRVLASYLIAECSKYLATFTVSVEVFVNIQEFYVLTHFGLLIVDPQRPDFRSQFKYLLGFISGE